VISRDDGRTWQAERVVATTMEASDHPLLITYKDGIWLSWHTGHEGLRIISLNHKP
jgi:hypothetical protein